MFGFLKKIFGTAQSRKLKKYFNAVSQINSHEKKLQKLSEDELRNKTKEFRERLSNGESLDDLLCEAYAVVKNACRRLQGTDIHVSGYDQKWDMIPYDVQIVGALSMYYGAIAEMQTGEGKTLTAAMPLYLNALTGKPVHLVTVNDYLAERDCEWIGSIFCFLGLSTGALTSKVNPAERKEIYNCDIVYGTASEFGFDYLRDNSMAASKEEQVQRGFNFTIIDEADSILIDEARTPLIISGPSPLSMQMYDELKGGISHLVRRQRDFCNKLATEANKVLTSGDQDKNNISEAYRKLWLLSKGTPRNKILKRLKEDPSRREAIDKLEVYYHSDQNKQERAQELGKLYITVDERSNIFELTDRGITLWEEFYGSSAEASDFLMIDVSDEYVKVDEDNSLTAEEKLEKKLKIQEEDARRKERTHNINQLLRAHLMMEKDVDYIVQDNKIVIIDENTGRPQPNRRFSDGLHQAIEAKEGLPIQRETQTYATITLQNYFRMYDKVAGMTGTAMTEAGEFKDIYGLDVLEIPTNVPCQREDANDEIYMSEREKYRAILKEIQSINALERPILVGTESVDISEKLSRILRQNNLSHTVLNAKNHEREAEIVAQAGQRSAITIATNMAGRGTDIKLGEGIANAGGLHVLGTTRHQSRRIDRQLRGRCARQGDPGTTKFFVSFEDQLLRLFASPRMIGMLKKFRPPEGEPISAGILNKSIETAQKRVEQRHYVMRKNTLEYDDVMNIQRAEIYSFRNEILHSEDIVTLAFEIVAQLCSLSAEKFLIGREEEGGWDHEGFRLWLVNHFPVSFRKNCFDGDYLSVDDIEQKTVNKIVKELKQKFDAEKNNLQISFKEDEDKEQIENRQTQLLQETIRNLIISKIDSAWQSHLLNMDHLRSEVHLQAVAQKDPLMEFKHLAFHLFDKLSLNMRTEVAQDLFKLELQSSSSHLQALIDQVNLETNRSFVGDFEEETVAVEQESNDKKQPVMVEQKVGRNEPCPCGSGKKYKKCCGRE